MKKLKIPLTAVGLLLGIGAAVATTPANRDTVKYGITSVSQDGMEYNVTPYDDANFKCEQSTTDECSLEYPAAGETQIAVDDPNISSLQPGAYQHK